MASQRLSQFVKLLFNPIVHSTLHIAHCIFIIQYHTMTTRIILLFLFSLSCCYVSVGGQQQQQQQEHEQQHLRGAGLMMKDPKTTVEKKPLPPHWSYDPTCETSLWNDCTPETHLRWTPHVMYDNPCEELVNKGIRSIIFLGNSYVCHAYIATVLYLSNNYERAGLAVDDPKCYYGGQFAEKECRKLL